MMMRTVTVVRQNLAAALFIMIGLIAYGCGDSATVNPAVELSSLSVTTGTTTAALQPRFSPATTDYTVQLSSGVTSVTVTARPAVEGDSVSINGQATRQRAITLEPPGQTTVVKIDVSESNTNSRTYTVKLVRAGLGGINSLKTLSVSPGTLNPAFAADEQLYRIDDVKSTDTKVTVTPTLEDINATMKVDGQDTASGQSREITLKPAGQTTTIEIFVKAQNGQVKQYHVEVPRGASGNNDLVNLTLSPVRLPGFNRNTLDYTVNVGSSVASVTVTPTLDDPTATLTVTSNGPGPITTSGQARTIPLRAAGLSTIINIVVKAQNGSEKPYTITVDRAAPPPPSGNNNLSALTVRLSTSSPNLISFSPNTTSYTVDVGSGVSTITVTPTLDDPTATLTVTSNGPGPITTSGQARTIPLRAAGLSTIINIVVKAQNGSEKPYTITVDRAAPPPPSGNNNLSALSVTPGPLSPDFVASTLNYTVNVGSTVISVTVTATLQDTAASMLINGQGTSSGVASAPITLGESGSSTGISIIVIAPNGDRKTYTITVRKRPAAPDLIPEDDSCPLIEPPDPLDPNKCAAGSREDNITNVTTPRFRIPQPAAGETPNLYVDGARFDSTFDQAANTLKPTAALSNGNHSITYTVTDSASLESPQSDPLEVTIDTGAPGAPTP